MSDEYPSDWNQRRKTVYQRDDYQCQRCGSYGGPNGGTELHAHHIQPKSEGGSHRLRNLTTLCRECHSNVHGHSVGGRRTGRQTTDYTANTDTSDIDTPILDVVFKWFMLYLLMTPFAVFLSLSSIGSFVMFAWMFCSGAIAVFTFTGKNIESTVFYTVYGILLCVVTPIVLEYAGFDLTFGFSASLSKEMLYPSIILVLTVIADYIGSRIFEDYSTIPTRFT